MPASITYSSVVSCDSVRIAFLIAALNNLDIMSADISNAYLNAPNKEKIWTVAGHEFGIDKGSVFIITRALYGLKSAGAAWRTFFAQMLHNLSSSPLVATAMCISNHNLNLMKRGIMKCYWSMWMIFWYCLTIRGRS